MNDPFSGKTVTGGIITFTDSEWLMSFTANRQPHFPDQPDDVIVLWVYALHMDKPGDYVKKSMPECTGKEILTEMCFHLGLIDQIAEIRRCDQSAYRADAIHHSTVHATCEGRSTMDGTGRLHQPGLSWSVCGNT